MISIIIPSMYRQNYLESCVDRIFETAGHLDFEIVLVIDEDVDSFLLAKTLQAESKRVVPIFNNERQGRHKAWNMGLSIARGDLFVHMGDDGLVRGNWLDLALKEHHERLQDYGMVAFNDLNLHGDNQVGTHVLFDRKFCKEVLGGVMVVPLYKSFCPDIEFNERAKRAGKYFWCRDAIIEHVHSSNNKRPLTRYEEEKTVDWEYDQNLLAERRQAGWPDNFPPVI